MRERFPDGVTQIQRDKMTEANRNRMRKAQRDGKSAFMLGFSLFLSLIYSATVVLNLQSDRKPPEETPLWIQGHCTAALLQQL